MKEINLLSSVALFRELYNNDKYQTIFDIVAEFIKGSVAKEGNLHLTSHDIRILLTSVYEFTIPESVIRTTLNTRMKDVVKKNGAYYQFDESILDAFKAIDDEFESINKIQGNIVVELTKFVEQKIGRSLEDSEQSELIEDFSDLLLDNEAGGGKFGGYIGAFVLLNEQRPGFKDNLNQIREGVILYKGISFTADVNELGKWKNDLTLYLNPEHLFNALGYNGTLFQEIFDDFFELVSEINISSPKSGGRKRIQLRYFEETKEEIDNFFITAELIQKGTRTLDPTRPAMLAILGRCKTASDIRQLRINFDLELKKKGILLQEFRASQNETAPYNVESMDLYNEIKKGSEERKKYFDEADFLKCLRIFTKINYYRKGDSHLPFERIGHILVTENSFVQYLAHHNSVKFGDHDTAFAKDMDFVTTAFWFKLKKGFADKNKLPKSFDVVNMARIVLSSHFSSSISKSFQDLLAEAKTGKLTKEEAIERSYLLREKPKKPEDFTPDNIDASLEFLSSETYFDDFVRERQRREALQRATQEENERLKAEIARRDEESERQKLERRKIVFSLRQNEYVNESLANEKKRLNRDAILLFGVVALTVVLVTTALIITLSSSLKTWLLQLGFWQIGLLLIYVLLVVSEIIGSKYIFDKERLKGGWSWIVALFNHKKHHQIKSATEQLAIEKFVESNSPIDSAT